MPHRPLLWIFALFALGAAAIGWFVFSGDAGNDDLNASAAVAAHGAGSAASGDAPAHDPADPAESGVRRAGPSDPARLAPEVGAATIVPGRVLGVIVKKGKKTPVPEIAVEIDYQDEDLTSQHVLSGVDGTFEIAAVRPETPFAILVHASRTKTIDLGVKSLGPGEALDLGEVEIDVGAALFGTVVDKLDMAVAKARVAVYENSQWQSLKDAFTNLDDYFAEKKPIAETRTNEKGEFEFRTLPEGHYLVEATAEGFSVSRKPDVWVNADGYRVPVFFRLGDPVTLIGWVKDDKGIPVVNAPITVMPDISGQDLVVINHRSHTETDERGRFEITDLEPGRKWVLVKTAYGRVHLEKNVICPGEVTIKLGAGGVVTGVVTGGEKHEPIAGVSLTFIGDGNYSTVQTDANGVYTVGPLKAGDYLILLEGAGLSLPQGKEKVRVKGLETRWDIDLVPGATVSGTVVDADTNLPIVGAEVTGTSASGFGAPTVKTKSAAEGAFMLTGVGLRDVQVFAWAPHYAFGPGQRNKQGTVFPVLLSGQVVEGVVVRIRKKAVVRGRITGPDGAPVARARVGTLQTSAFQAQLTGDKDDSTLSGEDGRYEFEIKPTYESDVGVRVTHPEFAPESFVVQRPQPDGVYVQDVMLTKPGVIEGRVRDGGGRPVAGAVVRATVPDARVLSAANDQDAARLGLFALTDTDGEFRMNVPGKKVVLQTRVDGYMIIGGGTQETFVAPEGVQRIRDIVVAQPKPMAGRVTDQDRRGVRGAKILFKRWGQDGYEWSVEAAVDPRSGAFRTQLPEGWYSMTISFDPKNNPAYDTANRYVDNVAAGREDVLVIVPRLR